MSRPKAAMCLQCVRKPARLGKEQGYHEHRFCSLRCGYRYAVERTVDLRWCAKHGEWGERGCWTCRDEDDQ